MSDYWLIPPGKPLDYSVVIAGPTLPREFVMARYTQFAIGALLVSLACASTYVLCIENTLLEQTSVYHLR